MVFQCDECEYKANARTTVIKHKMNSHANNTNYTCEKCNHQSKNNRALNNHKVPKHIESETQRLKCKECDFTANSEDNMDKHMKVAMGHSKRIQKQSFRNYLQGRCTFGEQCRFNHKVTMFQCDQQQK